MIFNCLSCRLESSLADALVSPCLFWYYNPRAVLHSHSQSLAVVDVHTTHYCKSFGIYFLNRFQCTALATVSCLCSANSCPFDYRPITITPVLSKVFECLLAKHLNNFAEKKNLFPNLQFGFRKSLGTCDALLTVTNFVQKALDCGSEVHMVGLDFSAAFDRVNHKALIFKLRQLGVGGPFLSILTEFLSNRLQRIVVDGQFNDYRDVVLGVPQGSVLGPLLICGLG